jgi:hypothetical protein
MNAIEHLSCMICGEIAARCIDRRTGRVKVPKNASKLAGDVSKWLQAQGKDEPSNSDMREAVRQVCSALRALQK